ncbi:MAG TPA: macro domain-containing protein [Methanospirillum sp.]|jgi:O-acetyl-ADP-ribose deacetylase (regulator of RNase III)|uniref:type II toxin-antitoxin system antitoxin DNA ADP-ribosyl glycohydrolase DarG n=1 Tax=Methanospirillum sp. TaxID=45200 RepID=UPI001BD5B3F3|nr:macro domain-containing protein [Methanospirillum sp.]MCZ2442997.1 macro domain-containing protein [Flavobacteriales bacterium]HPY59334.1 macro domain-containing protein [Methanospirillum sp.]
MMIQGEGNLLKADVDALVNTVNTVGVMGKGVALEFKLAFPDMYRQYKKACKNGEVNPGKMYLYHVNGLTKPSLIINFPTKRHWKEKSRLSDIEDGLKDLVRVVKELKIKSIALPPLGCGLGGLNWKDVYPRIESAFNEIPEVTVIVFPPLKTFTPIDPVIRTSKPKLTWIKSNILRIFERYCLFDYSLKNIEAQKLLYFFQESGENLGLTFVKGLYGPYSNKIGYLLTDIEGHYTTGHSTGSNHPNGIIRILPKVHDEITEFIEKNRMFHPDSEDRINRLYNLIRGFETPYGLELLATVHWICTKETPAPMELHDVINAVQNWNERKRVNMKPKHIEVAWKRLIDEGWILINDN